MRWVLIAVTLCACQPQGAPAQDAAGRVTLHAPLAQRAADDPSRRSTQATQATQPAQPLTAAQSAPSADARPAGPARGDGGYGAALRAHGWQTWGRLQDRWQSFVRSDAVLGRTDRVFRELPSFRNGDTLELETLPILFSVAFDPTAAAHIQRARLGVRAAQAGLRAVPEFPTTAIALKLVWYPVHRDRVTTLPIWDGEPTQPDARGNPPRTWRRTIAIDPRPVARPGPRPGRAGGSPRSVAPAEAPSTVPLDAFLYRTLADPAELAAARSAAHDPELTAGDYVVLLAMHVTTKESPDWLWATFWWHDRPDAGRFAADRPAAILGAARHYLMDVAYSADRPREPDGSQRVCLNPWLEARFPGGLHSNCLACHQRAAYGSPDSLPVTRGGLAPDDPYFEGKTTTDFLWTLAIDAR